MHHYTKRQRFALFIKDAQKLTIEQLVAVIRDKDLNPLARIAALRWLIARAPFELTQGRCYAPRRRIVRSFYAV